MARFTQLSRSSYGERKATRLASTFESLGLSHRRRSRNVCGRGWTCPPSEASSPPRAKRVKRRDPTERASCPLLCACALCIRALTESLPGVFSFGDKHRKRCACRVRESGFSTASTNYFGERATQIRRRPPPRCPTVRFAHVPITRPRLSDAFSTLSMFPLA